MIKQENPEPDNGAVFEMTNGEKIRIEYDRVFVYKSSQKSNVTVVELGFSPDTETVFLDVSFDAFDEKYQDNRRAWKAYWKAQDNSIY